MIFFTSDTHYNHKNIVRGTTDWEIKENSGKKLRPFDTMEEHNATLVKNINDKVKHGDVLYHLGDWSFGGFQAIKEFRDKIDCGRVHIILGNHDHHIERDKDRIRNVFESVQHYKEIGIGSQFIALCHYAMRVWNHSHKGSWMLYGHSHGSLDEMTPQIANPTWIGDQYYIKNWRTMDVGVDTNDLKPYSYEEIADRMKGRDVLLEVDHHGVHTT